jgi:hypothetical protein
MRSNGSKYASIGGASMGHMIQSMSIARVDSIVRADSQAPYRYESASLEDIHQIFVFQHK